MNSMVPPSSPSPSVVGIGSADPTRSIPRPNYGSSSALLATAPPVELRARIHSVPSEWKTAAFAHLRFRILGPDDLADCVQLHKEWFPTRYDESFYEEVAAQKVLGLGAVIPPHPPPSGASGFPVGSEADWILVGIITVATEHHSIRPGDIEAVRGVRLPWETKPTLAYILTLGVADGCRRRGLARLLVEQASGILTVRTPSIEAIFLHVIDYNEPAIRFYKSLGFEKVAIIKRGYYLDENYYDSVIYAFYFHKKNLIHFLRCGAAAVLRYFRWDDDETQLSRDDGEDDAQDDAARSQNGNECDNI